MKKIIKMHPLMFFTLIKPFLLLGIIPGVFSVFNSIFLKENNYFHFNELLFLLCFVLFVEIERKSLKIELFEDFFIVKKGLYFKSESKLYKNKITALYIKQNPIERLFSAKTVFINTLSDGKKSCEFKFVINLENTEIIEGFINQSEQIEKRKIPFLKVVFWAALSSSIFEGILLFAPIIKNTSRVLGIKIFDIILPKITDNLSFTDKHLSATVNTITAIFVLVYIIGFLYELFKNLNMRIKINKKSISVNSGIIVKRKTIFNSKETVGFCTEQTLLMRMLNRYQLKAVTGGYKGKFSGAAIVLPFESDYELNKTFNLMFSCYSSHKEYIAKKKAKFGAFSALWLPFFMSLALIGISIVLILVFYQSKRFIVFTLIAGVLYVFLYGYILLYGYKRSRISLNNYLLAEGTYNLKFKRLFLKKDGIAKIRLSQNPFDRKRGSCKVILTAYSKSREKIIVRWVNKTELIKYLENRV